jgi:malonyl-CoA decarboxylase
MLDELRAAAIRQRAWRALRAVVKGCKQLLSQSGEMNGLAVARDVIERLEELDQEPLDGFFDYLARELSPSPAAVLQHAQRYVDSPDAATLIALTHAVEPPRQELFRRLNRAPGGTAALLRLRRELHARLAAHPELAAIESDLLHLLSSWFNPGFLKMQRVDWHSPAQLLEKIIHHEAVHTIDGWDDLRRRLQPDRRCFAFFHPQLPEEPLIFVEVALLPEMPAAIAPLIDKHSTPMGHEQFRVAAFYSISNCEPGLRGVSLGNFLIKSVAEQLRRELPRLKVFCTLSPMPRFAAWLLQTEPFTATDWPKGLAATLETARATLLAACGGELARLQSASVHDKLAPAAERALLALGAAYLAQVSTTPQGDPVARFHLDNGARLERINLRGNLSAGGLKQAAGLMVNYLYQLDKIEANHARFRAGEVSRSREVAALL